MVFNIYRASIFAKIQAILCGWLLLISFMMPHRNLERLLPELWKPIFPFSFFEYSDTKMFIAVWAWRVVLVACLLIPQNPILLGIGFVLSFICLGLQNCFGLEMQLFASLQLAFFFLFLFSILSRRYGNVDCELAFSIKLIMVLMFFSAGLSKLKWSGFGWVTSDSLEQYFRMLYQINRNVFAYDWVLQIRHMLIGNETLIKVGAVGALAFELCTPLALFSGRISRLFVAGAVLFVFTVFIFLGIQFFTILPLLMIWGIWDVKAQDVFSGWTAQVSKQRLSVPIYTFIFFIFFQMLVTLYWGRNSWPVMMNDMYARPIATTPFYDAGSSGSGPMRDFLIEAVDRNGNARLLFNNSDFAPFSRFHIYIALLKARTQDLRNALLEKVLLNYRQYNCKGDCNSVMALRAVKVLDSVTLVLAHTQEGNPDQK